MNDVYKRRCAACHLKNKINITGLWSRPNNHWSPPDNTPPARYGEVDFRIQNPHLNSFLLAPLAKKAGGTQQCGKPIFESTDDEDYKAVLATFKPIHELLEKTPRMDMPGAKPASCCDVPTP
jgi:hypothetical protein